jgi:hypothetical protein
MANQSLHSEAGRNAMFLMYRCLGLALAVALGLSSAPALAQSWTVYRDSVSDCRLDYPSSLFTQEPFDLEQDIQRFSGPDDQTYFRVRGVNNQDKLNPSQIKARYLQSDIPGDIVYERTRPDFLVLSGTRGDSIFYTKVAVSSDDRMICILEITYPSSLKRRFDDVVTRMSRSFGVEAAD